MILEPRKKRASNYELIAISLGLAVLFRKDMGKYTDDPLKRSSSSGLQIVQYETPR